MTCTASQRVTQSSEEKNYLEYLELWKNILNPFKYNKSKVSTPRADQLEIRAVIYNEFIKSIIEMIQKLTLNYTAVAQTAVGTEAAATVKKDGNTLPGSTKFRLPDELRQQEPALRELLTAKLKRGKVELRASIDSIDASSDQDKTLTPQVPKDFELFLNLVEFCRLILLPSKTTSPKSMILSFLLYLFNF